MSSRRDGAAYQASEKKNLQAHVNFLSSDALAGRLTGSAGEQKALQYIATYFQELGLEPAGDQGSYFQTFYFDAGVKRQRSRNVVAKLTLGADPTQMIVVGAHVDHLGRGELGGSRARANEVGMIHAGADDNASGVAGMLEIAAKLSDLKAQGKLSGNKTIIFAAWSGEELGVLGSSHFVADVMQSNHATSLRPAIDVAINLDMIGHLREHLVLQGVGSSADWLGIINQVNTHHSMALALQQDPYLPTDSMPFYLHGAPTLNVFTGAHDDYHTPRDKPETLNYVGIERISAFLVDLILALEVTPNAIHYAEVKKPHTNSDRKFKIYLGTIPDYAHTNVAGVRLSGVAKYSPAENAGIKQDDVIVELGGKKIGDIYDYTAGLNTLKVGVPVKLVVMREKTRVALSVVARYRN